MVLDRLLLRARRSELGLTQAEVAELSGLGHRTVQTAELGRPIAASSAQQLSVALGIPYAALLRQSSEQARRRLADRGYSPVPPPTPWGARDDEAEQVRASILGDAGRCCIAGPSGFGKTALARFVTRGLDDAFPDGVVWVTAPPPDDVERVIALQLGVAEALGFKERLADPEMVDAMAFHASFQRWLWRRRRLLVLDDVSDPILLRWFSGACDPAWLLVTTAHRVVAEAFTGDVAGLGPLSEGASVRLLRDHIGQDRVQEDPDGARGLVTALGGVPRSLQIAGRVLARDRFTSPRTYAQRLAASVQPATRSWSDASGPDATFHSAWLQLRHHLSEAAWRLFGTLSVFQGSPFRVAWASAVSELEPAEARAHIGELADVYLVQKVGGTAAEPLVALDAQAQRVARWTAGDTFEVARDRLVQFARAEASRSADPRSVPGAVRRDMDLWRLCLNHLARLALPAETPPVRPDAIPAVERSALERVAGLPDLLVALGTALVMQSIPETGRWLRAGVAVAASLADDASLGVLAYLLGMWSMLSLSDPPGCQAWSEFAAGALDRAGRTDEVTRSLLAAGAAAWTCRGPRAAVEAHEKALATARGSPLLHAIALNNLAVVCLQDEGDRERWHRADALLDRALSIPGKGTAHEIARAHGVVNRAVISRVMGEPVPAAPTRDAIAQLHGFVQGYEIDSYRMRSLARFLDAEIAAAPEPPGAFRFEMLLAIPPERLERELIQLTGVASLLPAAREMIWAAGMCLEPASPSPSGPIGITDILIGLPIQVEVGAKLALLYPAEPMARLLDGEGIEVALRMVSHLCAEGQLTRRVIEAIATSQPG